MRDDLIPESCRILRWIETIYERGIRRPGYPADRQAVEASASLFRELGLENVRLEPVSVPFWEPRSWSLRAFGVRGDAELRCFPLPHSAPTDGLELELTPWDPARPAAVEGKASLHDMSLLRLPPGAPAAGGSAVRDVVAGSGSEFRPGGKLIDPRNTFEGAVQVLPFGPLFQSVMEPAISAGAAAYLGALTAYPGDSCDY